MPRSDNRPGIKHAPGVKCIVAVPLSEGAAIAQQPAQRFFGPNMKLMTEEQLDNGRLVRLNKVALPGYTCTGCGRQLIATDNYTPLWEVSPADGRGKFSSGYVTCNDVIAVFFQKDLIPLGGEDLELQLIEEERQRLLEEADKKLQDAAYEQFSGQSNPLELL